MSSSSSVPPPSDPLFSVRRREFHWTIEVEAPGELRLPDAGAPGTDAAATSGLVCMKERPVEPSPQQRRQLLLRRQLREMVQPMLWAMAYVGFILGIRGWVG